MASSLPSALAGKLTRITTARALPVVERPRVLPWGKSEPDVSESSEASEMPVVWSASRSCACAIRTEETLSWPPHTVSETWACAAAGTKVSTAANAAVHQYVRIRRIAFIDSPFPHLQKDTAAGAEARRAGYLAAALAPKVQIDGRAHEGRTSRRDYGDAHAAGCGQIVEHDQAVNDRPGATSCSLPKILSTAARYSSTRRALRTARCTASGFAKEALAYDHHSFMR